MSLKAITNEKGVALVTSLMLTLISLTIIMALLYMITAGTKLTGAQKRYKSSLDAANGGAEIALKDIMPTVMRNVGDANLVTLVQNDFTGVNLQVNSTMTCLQAKLTTPTDAWPAGCSNVSEPKQAPDMTMTLQATAGNSFQVYAKIVDTVKGNSETSGLQLEGTGVSENSPTLSPQHFPYVYRLEVQGERAVNAQEQANISALYAY
jgi:hypothetical protein